MLPEVIRMYLTSLLNWEKAEARTVFVNLLHKLIGSLVHLQNSKMATFDIAN